MILALVGAFLLLLGLFCGLVLLLVPLGVASWSASPVVWVLFPVFCLAGHLLLVTGARLQSARGLTMAASGALLLMAAVSALGLVLHAAGVFALAASSLSLWFVLAVAGVLGLTGAALAQRRSDG